MFVLPLPHYVTGLTKFAYRLRMRSLVIGIDLAPRIAVEVITVVPLMTTMVGVGPLLEAIVHDAKITAIALRLAAATTTIPETAIALHHRAAFVALLSMTILRVAAIARTRMRPHPRAVIMKIPIPMAITIARRELELHLHELIPAGMRSAHVTGINSLPVAMAYCMMGTTAYHSRESIRLSFHLPT